ncbi:hemolysin family protein [Brevibacillus fulvus]|uniref:CBS domain containing-hemolysin-like protein n=1 Tax=Brevibacillus fulvus TaxID=1125967 RepID=A0A938Y206_9BACL|nr:hemolysin family protein [Brevibacillus fulvus]MBM7590939.1 CBS domain containing-hemolysin-like protein [Brevibacillus fulvus]
MDIPIGPIGEILLNLLLVFFLVLLNGFFVAAEFALVKVRQSRLTQLASEGNKRAKYAQAVTHKLDAYLSACQLGITLASLGLGWVGEPAIAHFVEPVLISMHLPTYLVHPISIAIAFCIMTFLHITFGELAPKSMAIQKSEAISLWTAAPLMFFHKIAYPAIYILNGTANFFIKRLGIEPATEEDSAHTEEEIRILVNESHKSGFIDQTELVLVDNVFEFSDRLAREIMIPRIDMVCLYDDSTYEENLEIMRNSRHSRFPVAHEDKDNLIGFVHTTDFYLAALSDRSTDLKDFLRPLLTVPESMEVSQVLRLMQKRRSQMAIVIDEYGGTAGLITMEDILEEIVGDIQDEFDENERPEVENVNNALSVSGKTLLTEINDYIPIEIHSDDVDTIAGWIYSQLNEDIAVGKSVKYENYLFTITELDNHRITRVGITQIEDDANPPDESDVLVQAQ